jgi:glycyl-tRNA synthetase
MTKISMDQIVSFCKRRGLAYPGSSIYGGFANSYTYGPYGVELKNNIKKLWWRTFIHEKENIVGIDGDIILHPRTWEASGHVGGFNDQMIDCKKCKSRFRADHIIENQLNIECEGLSDEDVTKLIQENNIQCPTCKSIDFTDVRKFNLMFETEMAKTKNNSSEKEQSKAYLRPETAQAIFLEFKNVVDTMRVKLPFGIGQIGKAFRNEITPGNFIFRRLEFEQMEIEYFIHEKNWKEVFETWHQEMKKWCDMIGLNSQKYHDYEHPKEKLSHYSKRTVDIEYDFPFGRKELYGLAYRTNFDLSQHEKFSTEKLRMHDETSGEKILPHVIEPTFGVDRTVLAVLCEGYTEEKLLDQTERTVLRIVPALAPVKVAVLPLLKKDQLPEKAKEIFAKVQCFGNCEFDISGAIGKRYRRQDEIGTPVCVTIDHETLENDTVTIRDRDTMNQERVKISDLVKTLSHTYFYT